jgi:hypothetical protein
MNPKPFLLVFLLLFFVSPSFAQHNEILLTYKNQKTSTIKAGDAVRISYPGEKLAHASKKKDQVGIRGKIETIGKDKIVMKALRGKANLELDINEITAIKKTPSHTMLIALGSTFAIIGGAAILGTTAADLNPAVTAFSTAASVFPALILTTSVYYPAKPRQKVGEDYKMEVITVH